MRITIKGIITLAILSLFVIDANMANAKQGDQIVNRKETKGDRFTKEKRKLNRNKNYKIEKAVVLYGSEKGFSFLEKCCEDLGCEATVLTSNDSIGGYNDYENPIAICNCNNLGTNEEATKMLEAAALGCAVKKAQEN